MEEMKIERDARVLLGDREVGRVAHVLVDPQTREVTEVVVAHGDRQSAIPIAEVVGVGGGMVRLREGGGVALRGDFVRDDFHGLDDRTADAENAGVATHGGAPLRDAEDNAVTIGHVVPVVTTPSAIQDRLTPRQSARATDTTDTVDTMTVPVAEERLRVGKREVDLGAVEIRKTVTEEEQTVPVKLHRDEVTVQEVEVADRPLRVGEDAFNEGTIRVQLRGEEAVVAKEAIVTGEVVIDKEQIAEERTISDTVRKEHVDVAERAVGERSPRHNTRKERRNV